MLYTLQKRYISIEKDLQDITVIRKTFLAKSHIILVKYLYT